MTLSCSDCFPLTWVGVAHRSFSFPPITPHTCLPTTYNNHPLTCCSISQTVLKGDKYLLDSR
uniref:Uncharacterized protein n=1 Tax=Scophthalmus maximus TaxID=52904 RepID=A0A8D2ZL44_SCOMX